jgi:hypothetical protein
MIRLLAARLAGLVAGLGALVIVLAVAEGTMRGVSLRPGPFWEAFLLLAVASLVAKLWIGGAEEAPKKIRSEFALTALGSGALLTATCAVMVPMWDTKEAGFRTQMISDLTALRRAQEEFRSRTGAYARVLPASDFEPLGNVGPPRISLTADGWTASVGHVQLPAITCVVYMGSTPLAPARNAGEPTCTNQPVWRGVFVGLVLIAAGALMTAALCYRSG